MLASQWLCSHSVLDSYDFLLINLYADWCRFSQQLKPIFDQAADKVAELNTVSVSVCVCVCVCVRVRVRVCVSLLFHQLLAFFMVLTGRGLLRWPKWTVLQRVSREPAVVLLHAGRCMMLVSQASPYPLRYCYFAIAQ